MALERSIRGRHALVAGGAGFIGSHLVDLLLRSGAGRVTVVDSCFLGSRLNLKHALDVQPDLDVVELDLSDYGASAKLLNRLPAVDVVFNLAVVPLPASLERPHWSFSVNVNVAATLCELLRQGRYGTLIHFSSSEAYGTAKSVPMSEDHPLDPLTPYAASKASGDHLVGSYVATFGLDAAVIRPFNNYGPRQNDREYAAIIPVLLRCATDRQTFHLHGDGLQTRDFLYVTDTARAALDVYGATEARGRVLNVGSGQETSMIQLIETIERILGQPIARDVHPQRPGDVLRHCANASRLKQLTGFEPRVTLDDGLAATVEAYLRRADES